MVLVLWMLKVLAFVDASWLQSGFVPILSGRASTKEVATCRLGEDSRLAQAHVQSVLTLPYIELCELVGKRDARSTWNLYRIGEDPSAVPNAGDHSPKYTVSATCRQMLSTMTLPMPAHTERVSVSSDGTIKLLIRLDDGLAVESVLIPPLLESPTLSSRSKTSLCISSQVGCMRGCRFCSTGAMGIIRNLSPAEILAQVVFSRREAAARGLPSVDNIVFMGMGEPLDNPDGLVQALQALTDPNRFAFSKTKVLVSTVAPSPQSLQVLSTLDCQIAWSLHAPDDALRKALVPSTRHTLQQLRDAMAQVLAERARRSALHSLMLEYVLLQDVNDSLLHAQALAAFLEPLHSVTRDSSKPQRSRTGLLVNLIPFNQGTAEAEGLNGFKRPSRTRVRAFQARIYVALAVLALKYQT